MVVLLKLADREAEAPYIQHKLKQLWILKWSFPVFLNHDSKIVKHHKSHTFTFKRKAYQHLLYRKWKRFKASYTYMFHLSLFALTVIYTLCLSVRYPAGGLWERKYSKRWRERDCWPGVSREKRGHPSGRMCPLIQTTKTAIVDADGRWQWRQRALINNVTNWNSQNMSNTIILP